jgi:hypothetical protein
MAEEDKKKTTSDKHVSDEQRFHYIGFDVFPGKAKDLFKSSAEKDKLVDALKAKRESGQIIRDECTLFEDRVSGMDRIVMTIACAVMLLSLFLPWFAVYNEVEETTTAAVAVEEPLVVDDSLDMMSDSAALAMAEGDTLGVAGDDIEAVASEVLASATEEEAVAGDTAGEDTVVEATSAHQQRSSEEVIHGYVAKKKYTKHFDRVGGLGAFVSLGSVGSAVFSSGAMLVVSAILMLLMILATLGLPLYSLYGLFGLKGTSDQKALALKKILKLNWIPMVLFTGVMFLAFVGANYGFDSESLYTSLGRSYGVGVFMDSLSWGAFVSISASVLLAVKGIEI